MSIQKVVGIEQEYAIRIKGGEDISPFQASCMLINAYAAKVGLREPGMRVLWDYGHETPFQDIRGDLFDKRTGQEITRDEDNLAINTILPNGARLYTDHAHPEYSTPECMSAREVIASDKAGERILVDALGAARQIMPEVMITLFKNNVDHQGHSYGCHENYLMDAAAHHELFAKEPQKVARTLIPFLVTRQVFAGAGKAGQPYQISQRADFMETLFGIETMYSRPIINTRQEHHADAGRFRRLHLILGDSNMCEFAGMLKVGATQMVLQMVEDNFIQDDFTLRDPLRAVKQISARFDHEIELANGTITTAADLQRRYFERAFEYHQNRQGMPGVPGADEILDSWDEALDGLGRLKLSEDFDIDDDPADLRRRLDWMLKLWLLNRYRHKKSISWDHPQMKILDLQYHGIDPGDSVFYSLQEQGLVQRMLEEHEIEMLVQEAPPDTRAYFRGMCVRKFPKEVYLVNWEVVGFDHGDVHRMVPLLNPLKGTRERFQKLFEQAANSKELLCLMKNLNDQQQ